MRPQRLDGAGARSPCAALWSTPEVEITREALKALLTTLPPERDSAIERTDDGYYLIKMNVDSLLQLMDLDHEEETLSDVIVRLVSERMDSGRTRPQSSRRRRTRRADA